MWITYVRSNDGRLRSVEFGFIRVDLETGTVSFLGNQYDRWVMRYGHPLLIDHWPYPFRIAPGEVALVIPDPESHPRNPYSGRVLALRMGSGAEVRWEMEREVPGRPFVFFDRRFTSLMAPDGWLAIRGGWIGPEGQWVRDPDLDLETVGVGEGRSVLLRRNDRLVLRPDPNYGRSCAVLGRLPIFETVHAIHVGQNQVVCLGGNLRGEDVPDLELFTLDIGRKPEPRKSVYGRKFHLDFLRWTPEGAVAMPFISADGESGIMLFTPAGRSVHEIKVSEFKGGGDWRIVSMTGVSEDRWIMASRDLLFMVYMDSGFPVSEILLHAPLYHFSRVPGGILTVNGARDMWAIIPESGVRRDELHDLVRTGHVRRVERSEEIAAIAVSDSVSNEHARNELVIWPSWRSARFYGSVRSMMAWGDAAALIAADRDHISLLLMRADSGVVFRREARFDPSVTETNLMVLPEGIFVFELIRHGDPILIRVRHDGMELVR